MTGQEASTTVNRMAMTGALDGLQRLSDATDTAVYSDNRYLCNGFNMRWVDDWERRGWQRAKGTLQNADLWRAIQGIIKRTPQRRVRFVAVENDAGYEEMEEARRLAIEECRSPR